MNRKIVILTGSELRHTYMRKAIALDPEIEVVKSVCEKSDQDLQSFIDPTDPLSKLQEQHLAARAASEKDFFEAFVTLTEDQSNPVFIEKGGINEEKQVEHLIDLNPDLLVAYGCSLIKGKLLEQFKGRCLNVHLGLSPYYRGSGTNFWPLVNNEPEYVGATFMYLDEGVDTGKIIHQMRAEIKLFDTPHSIGNRLIAQIAPVYAEIIKKLHTLKEMPSLPELQESKVYRKKDFTPEAVKRVYENFENGLVETYLSEKEERIKNVPIIEHDAL